jgi:hypothetical protein
MPNNSTLQLDQTLPAPLAQAPRLHLALHNLLPKPPVSPTPSGAEREAQTSLAMLLPAFPSHRGQVRSADKSMSAPRAAALRRAQIYFFAVLLASCFTCSAATRASELTQATAEAFQRYVRQTEVRMQSELGDPEHFLYSMLFPKRPKTRC